MPLYDYRCSDCGFADEAAHGMNESPHYECPECGASLKRVYGAVNLNHGAPSAKRRVEDHLRRESDMSQDLTENHGVEKFAPLARGVGVSEVYSDVKASGSYVKDRMQAEKEISDVNRRKKQGEWMRKAMKRAPGRSRERVERKAAEQSAKRAIRLSA